LNAKKVGIVKTFGSKYLSTCVIDAIESAGADIIPFGMKHPYDAVVVVHEFGIPVFQDRDIKVIEEAKQIGIPIIEDCAWRTDKVFDSQYQVYSLTKTYGFPFGGILHGVELDDEYMWSIGCLDTVKREKYLENGVTDVGADVRVRNWMLLRELMEEDGMRFDDCYDYRQAVLERRWVPTMMFMKCRDDDEVDYFVDRLARFGIQAGHYWGEPLLILPVHQAMTADHIRYMFAVIKGGYNLCNSYGGKSDAEE
jgi:hypothetical protein